jgi:hypothetical protein
VDHSYPGWRKVTTSIGRLAGIALSAAVFAVALLYLGLVQTVLHIVIAAGIIALVSRLQRKDPLESEGWKILTAGGMEWLALILGSGLTGLFAYVFFFVGSARHDAAFQMLMLQVLIVAFAIMTAFSFYSVFMVTTRWNDWRLEQDSFIFGKRTICFTDVSRLLPLTWADVLRIDAVDGTRIYVPLYRNGAAAFVDELMTKLGLHNRNSHEPEFDE